MTNDRPRGFLPRLRSLIHGLFGSWVRDRESRNPQAVYEAAIAERTRQYAELKQAVAGILYMRNKLEGEISERRGELARVHEDVRRAVLRNDDEVALALISHKETLLEDLERTQRELDEVTREVEGAKTNLVKFRGEIRLLEREKVRMLATLANARARRRIQEALDGLSLDTEMRALDSVREHIQRMRSESRLDQELADSGLQDRMRTLRDEARTEAARQELVELKRRLRPEVLLPEATNGAIPLSR
jgi:phage shock protein A